MDISSGRARVTDLAFQVFNRSIHPDWFTCLAFRRLVLPGWEVDLRLIPGGHAILWFRGRTQVAEVLSPGDQALPERGVQFRSSIRKERALALMPASGIEYQTCFSVEHLSPEVFRHVSEELALAPCRDGLRHRERPATRLSSSPLSQIEVDRNGRRLSVHAFHTFPDEHAVVRTQSLFEIRE